MRFARSDAMMYLIFHLWISFVKYLGVYCCLNFQDLSPHMLVSLSSVRLRKPSYRQNYRFCKMHTIPHASFAFYTRELSVQDTSDHSLATLALQSCRPKACPTPNQGKITIRPRRGAAPFAFLTTLFRRKSRACAG